MISRSEVVDVDRAHIWRPYTSTEDHRNLDPFVIERAEGVWLYDMDGRRYMDGNASWWVSNLGHRHPRLCEALRRQLDRLAHCAMAGATHPVAAELARDLAQSAPQGLSRVFFSDDGSTAVEVAIKIAFQYFQQNNHPERNRFISLAGAFHGDTIGTVSLGGVEAFRRVFGPLLFDVIQPPRSEDHPSEGWHQAIEHIERVLHEEGSSIAAVVIEPMLQGASGMQIWSAPLLKRLADATRKAGALLIADEVFTGLGRTGRMWACEHAEVTPDLLCSSKGLSGGMLPFAATLATEAVFSGFDGGKERALMHGHSFYGNPLGAAVAREVLAIYRDQGILAQLPPKMEQIRRAFDSLGELPWVHHPRALGMMGAVEIGSGRDYFRQVGWEVCQKARERGVYLRPLGNTIYIAPPLTISQDELRELLVAVTDAVRSVQA